jgi:hypothetical protein
MPIYNDYGAGAIGSAVQGLLQGLQAGEETKMRKEEFSENKRFREMELNARMKADDESRARQKALDEYTKQKDADERRQKEFQLGAELRTKGFQVPSVEEGQSLYDVSPSQLKYDPEYLALKRKAESVASDPYGLKETNALLAKERLDKALAESKQRKASPVPGYEKTEAYVGDQTEERALRAAKNDLDKFRSTMASLKSKVQNADQMELANPYSNVSKEIKNDLRDLQLTYKGDAFAKLGVLTGPDLAILEDVIENPGSVSNVLAGKEGVIKRYDQALGRVNQAFDSKIQTLGLMPAMKDEGLIPDDSAMVTPPVQKQVAPDAAVAAKQARLAELLAKKAKGGRVANGTK